MSSPSPSDSPSDGVTVIEGRHGWDIRPTGARAFRPTPGLTIDVDCGLPRVEV
jgi:hypothetical protein